MSLRQPSLRKAAILVACLDHRTADLLLAQMPTDQADEVRRAILRLGDVESDEQDKVIDEFVRIGPLVPNQDLAGIELDGALAARISLPSRHSTEAAASDRHPSKPSFHFLHETQFETLLPFLRREHPQTIAVVLSHLPADRASDLLTLLPAPIQTDVIRRLSELNEMDPDAIAEVERGLQQWINEQGETRQRRVAGLAAVSAILEAAPATARRQIMGNLARHDRPLAGKLHKNRYTFADLIQFDDEDLVLVLRAADGDLLVLALAGASPQFVDRISRRLPVEQAKTLAKALSHLGPTRLADVDEAKQAIADLAAEMEADGRLQIQHERPSLAAA